MDKEQWRKAKLRAGVIGREFPPDELVKEMAYRLALRELAADVSSNRKMSREEKAAWLREKFGAVPSDFIAVILGEPDDVDPEELEAYAQSIRLAAEVSGNRTISLAEARVKARAMLTGA